MDPFYVSHPLVKNAWKNGPNFKEVAGENPNGEVYIYFSSNGLYYPNTEENFHKSIIEKDRYDFFNFRSKGAATHVFLRDVHKQWYVTGISRSLPDLPSVIEFLRDRYKGKTIITVGSSAGAYAAIIAGVQLQAKRVFAFAPQLDLISLAEKSDWKDYELVQQFKNVYTFCSIASAAEVATSVKSNCIYYFAQIDSKEDQEDIQLALKSKTITPLLFQGNAHGVPIIAPLLPKLLASSAEDLSSLAQRSSQWGQHRFGFHLIGIRYVPLLLKYKLYQLLKKYALKPIVQVKKEIASRKRQAATKPESRC
ncbi:hypothetical protein SH580_06560 [Coraliomargarita algicola]|uniref:Uncharacterized protein n=1 Tax=Coraliomargarita algicola TaxID=3092156 RepID=A0ABZ0RWI8_9BACT|nr:hypothetical protein [Coraliomargarita sp. J2-16]WPJ97369.1 hypothetical protein SH580_06560 [Coraliomargarita sp. J2-16]